MVYVFVQTLQKNGMQIASDTNSEESQLNNDIKQIDDAFTKAMNRADAAFEEGKLHDAEAALESALRMEPENEAVLGKLAFILEQQGDDQAALGIYERALEIHKNAPSLYAGYASLLHKLGRADDAKANFIEAVQLEPNSAVIYYNFANLLLELGEKDAAKQGYEEALNNDKDFKEAKVALEKLQ